MQVDLSKVASATQSTNLLAGAVVNLAMAQLGTVPDSINNVPLADLLLSEPFAVPIKNLKKDSPLNSMLPSLHWQPLSQSSH